MFKHKDDEHSKEDERAHAKDQESEQKRDSSRTKNDDAPHARATDPASKPLKPDPTPVAETKTNPHVRAGDSVNIVNINGQSGKGKITAIHPNGVIDVIRSDGTALNQLAHVSVTPALGWHHQSSRETLDPSQPDSAVITIKP